MILLLVNWQDAPLRPEVKQALDWQMPDAVKEDNGFLILMGIHSPPTEDAHAIGKQILNDEIARYALTRETLEEPQMQIPTAPTSTSEAEFRCDYTQQNHCLDFYLQQPTSSLRLSLESQQPLIARYDAIKHSQHYIELVMPMLTARLPDYKTLMKANELGRVQAALYVQQQQFSEALALLEDNARFSRRLLNNASTLTSYVVALEMIQKEARLTSELLIRYPALAQTHATSIATILAPIPINSFGLKQALGFERAMQLGVTRVLKKERLQLREQTGWSIKSKIAEKLYQPNATANLFYDLASQPMQLVDASAKQLNQTAKALAKQQRGLLGIGYPPYYLQNPMGKILASISQLNAQKFIEKHHDVEGYLTLVRLQHALIGHTATTQDIHAIRVRFMNPYTEQPMNYDAANKVIHFTGRQPSSSTIHKSPQHQIAIGD